MFFVFIHYAWLFTQVLIGGSLLLPVVLFVSHSFLNLFKKALPACEELLEEKDFAVIVHAHEQAQNIESLVQSLLSLNYTNYLIYIVTNNNTHCFFNEKIIVLPSEKPGTSKLRLYRFVIENFKRPHTHLAIFGGGIADNEYLNQLNVFFNKGYQAVQGSHSLKQSRTLYDLIYSTGNQYHRLFKGELPFRLHASATLAGCGAAFNVSFFKQCLKRMSRSRTGTHFMQNIESEMMNRGHQIAFASNAVVYSDKTISAHQLINIQAQSMNRWLTQFVRSSFMLFEGIISFKHNLILSGLILLQPSLFAVLLLSVFCLLSNVLMQPATAIIWIGCLLLFLVCFLIAVVKSTNRRKFEKAERLVTSLPMFFYTKKRKTEAA